MGTLYKRGKHWTIGYMLDGKQRCESTGTTNRRLAEKILAKRLGEIVEGLFQLPNSNPPRLQQFSEEFLKSVRHPNTKKRYASSVANGRYVLTEYSRQLALMTSRNYWAHPTSRDKYLSWVTLSIILRSPNLWMPVTRMARCSRSIGERGLMKRSDT